MISIVFPAIAPGKHREVPGESADGDSTKGFVYIKEKTTGKGKEGAKGGLVSHHRGYNCPGMCLQAHLKVPRDAGRVLSVDGQRAARHVAVRLCQAQSPGRRRRRHQLFANFIS